MHYVSATGLAKSYGIKPLFSDIAFHISAGDKIALVARNGSGKTTLLKMLAGLEFPDEGRLWINREVDISFFEQEPVLRDDLSVTGNIFHMDHPVIRLIRDYETAVDAQDEKAIQSLLVRMDEASAWDFESKVKQILGKLRIDYLRQQVGTLSGGQKKRAALARTLIETGFRHKHVLLIMDEPTNHLDVEMVEWLENYLDRENCTLLLVTHDRYFLDSVCTTIWELADGNLYIYRGGYQNFIEKKAQREESESASLDKARNLYRKELEWMRKQPKARTTKSKSRIAAFHDVEQKAMQQADESRLQLGSRMNRLGGKTVELKKVYKRFGEKVILQGFDYIFKKGERVGVIGRNGTGKSTFINILQGRESVDSGKVNIGDTVVFGNYSQQGLEVKEDLRVIEYVKNIAENFPLAGGGTLGAAQFLNLFLFPPEQQYTHISRLSGGEKRRLHLLTILFRNPNFLILDEPTNDLDLPTLTVLENFLLEFTGCLVIVSHDRYFMDRLVDHLFVFEGDGVISDFPGNFSRYRESQKEREEPVRPPRKKEDEPKAQKKRLSFREQREFEMLEKELEALNLEKQQITERLSAGDIPFGELQQLSERIVQVSAEIDEKEMRWLELSEIGG